MATKKKVAGPPVDVPGFLLEDDGNKAVARATVALAKKWSLTRKESLADTARLGWFYVALGRDREARELAEYVCERVAFTGDLEAWAAASQSLVLAARLARLRGDDAHRASLVARLVEHPSFAATPREVVAEVDLPTPPRTSAPPRSSPRRSGPSRASPAAAPAPPTSARPPPTSPTSRASSTSPRSTRTIEEGLSGLRAYLAR